MINDSWSQLLSKIDISLDSQESEDSQEEEAVILMISARVENLLNTNPEILFSSMYRMDVSEARIKNVMNTEIGASLTYELAKLIWKRQKQRFWTKKNVKVDQNWNWDD